MRLFEAFLQEPTDANPTLTAIAPATAWSQKTYLRHVVVLKIGEGMALPIRYNSPALILNTESMNILLGYFDPADKHKHFKKTIADGDMFLTCGSTRGVRTGDDGGVELVNMFRKDDGEIVITPIVSYSKDNELKIGLEKLVIDMLGANAGGNIAWTQDKTLGFNTFATNYKTSNKDIGPRVYSVIEGTPSGPSIKYIWDVTPSPVGGVMPDLIETGLPQNVKVKMGGGTPFSFTYNLGPAAQLEISIDPTGALTIQNKINQAMIAIDTSGAVTAQGTAGLGKVEMSPAGKVSISGVTGVSIDGTAGLSLKGAGGQVLSEILANVIQNLMAHTHVTAMGPSGPPLPPAVVQLPIQLGLAKAFKGGA